MNADPIMARANAEQAALLTDYLRVTAEQLAAHQQRNDDSLGDAQAAAGCQQTISQILQQVDGHLGYFRKLASQEAPSA